MKINHLKLNGYQEPLGYHFTHLSFSWRLIGDVHEVIRRQTVMVSENEDFQPVILTLDGTNSENLVTTHIDFLKPRTKYYWKIITETEKESVEKISHFETGKMAEDWHAEWITYQEESLDSAIFCKEFQFSKKVKKARLYSLGYGIYEAYINDENVTDEVLLPGYHSYDLLNAYQTFDVTDKITNMNKIKLIVGNGWYKGRFVFEGGYENIYGDRQKVIAELIVEFEDGTTEIISTDKTWQVTTSFVKENSIYDGETLDLSQSETQTALTIQTLPMTLPLSERSNLPIRRMKELKPVEIFYDKKDNLILDFGQVITGWLEGWIESESSKIQFKCAELLQEESFYQENLRTAKQKWEISPTGKKEYIRPHFTFFSFRYVEVTGITMEEVSQLSAFLIHSEMEELFNFDSSHDKLNRLVENIKWSQRDNFLDIPTDCPQRDERMGWTGDVTIFSNTSCYNMDTKGFYANYLRNLALEQDQLSGSVPFFVPFPKIKPHENINPFLVSSGSAVWADVATVLPHHLFKHFKDVGLLKQTIPVMKKWVDYVYSKDVANGSNHLWNFDQQLGDWLALDNGNPQNPIGATDPDLISSIYYYRSSKYLALALEKMKDETFEFYQDLSSKIKAAIISKYFIKDDLQLEKYTQTGLSLLLREAMYPSEIAKIKLVANLKKVVVENNGYLNTGFVGTPELIHALAESGLNDLAFNLLFNEDCPSWLFEVNMGATTVWERWNSILSDGTISGTEMNSLNHYAYGAVEDFIIEKVIGLSHTMEKRESFTMLLNPIYDQRIQNVSGELMIPNGVIKVTWYFKTAVEIELIVDVPHSTCIEYTNRLGETVYLNSGTHCLFDTLA